MTSSLAKAEMLVKIVLPQAVVRLKSIKTFGEVVDSRDVESMATAQSACDRFLNGIREVAVRL